MKNRGKARFFCVSSIVFITSGKEYGMVNLKSHHVLFAQLMLFDPGERVELKRLENKQRMNPRYTAVCVDISRSLLSKLQFSNTFLIPFISNV